MELKLFMKHNELVELAHGQNKKKDKSAHGPNTEEEEPTHPSLKAPFHSFSPQGLRRRTSGIFSRPLEQKKIS
jgi:hypothetical protein